MTARLGDGGVAPPALPAAQAPSACPGCLQELQRLVDGACRAASSFVGGSSARPATAAARAGKAQGRRSAWARLLRRTAAAPASEGLRIGSSALRASRRGLAIYFCFGVGDLLEVQLDHAGVVVAVLRLGMLDDLGVQLAGQFAPGLPAYCFISGLNRLGSGRPPRLCTPWSLGLPSVSSGLPGWPAAAQLARPPAGQRLGRLLHRRLRALRLPLVQLPGPGRISPWAFCTSRLASWPCCGGRLADPAAGRLAGRPPAPTCWAAWSRPGPPAAGPAGPGLVALVGLLFGPAAWRSAPAGRRCACAWLGRPAVPRALVASAGPAC